MKKSCKILGILNVTPDSFSDGGQYFSAENALTQAEKLIHDGADLIDIGGESTRPGAEEIDPLLEWKRIQITGEELVGKFPRKISLDTRHWQTAEKFLQAGGTIINDVSGCRDPKMIEQIAKHNATVIVNHFPGDTPSEVHRKAIDSLQQVVSDLLKKKIELESAGISAEKIILDPGIGFGKTNELNWKLLEFAKFVPGENVLIGHSKKRFLGTDRYEKSANVKAGNIAIQSGCKYLRVHNPEWYS